jgi:signal transduction histidine kinase
VNVIGNALKFTAHGSVQVRVHSTASQVVIRVQDTGPGIPTARLDSIFDAFEQVNGSTHRRHGGTGLGLAISRSIVGLLGGTLTVESVFGSGSTFHIALPRLASAPVELAA